MPLSIGIGLGTVMGQDVAAPKIFGPDQAAFVRLTDHGDATGLDWDNALSPASMGYIRANSAPGTVVNIRADEGDYTIDADLHSLPVGFHGMPDARITVRGVDVNLDPMKAVFNGTRDAAPSAKITGTTANGSKTITGIADTSALVEGMTVMGSHIPANSTIQSIVADTSITIENDCTGNGTNTIICAVLLYRTDFETSGYDLFDLGTGASYVDFENFTVNDMGHVFLALCNLTDCTFTDIDCTNVFGVFNSEIDTHGTSVPIDTYFHSTLTFTRVPAAGYSSGGIRTWHNPLEIVIIDCDFNAEGQIDIAFNGGCHIGGTGRLSTRPAYLADNPGGGPIITGSSFKNHWYHSTAANYPNSIYWNSDGLWTERGIAGALIRDCTFEGNTDGGVDLKGPDFVLDGCTSRGNKFNAKVWDNGQITGCTFEDPVKLAGTGGVAHISLFGTSSITLDISDITVTGNSGNTATFLDVSSADGSTGGAQNVVNIDGYTVSLQSGATLVGTPTPPSTIEVNWDPPLDAYTPDNTEAADLFAAMLAGGNALDDTNKALVDAAYTTLKANDALACFDLLYIWPATTAQDQALYNWVDPSAHKLTPQGGVAYDAGSGFHGNLVDGYLDSGLAANAATNYKQDDACIVVAVWDDVQRVVDSGAASSAMAKLVGRTTGNLFLGRLNASSDKSIANTNGQGVFVINKLDATHYEFDINGVSTAVTASGSTALTANNFTPLRVSGAFAGTQRQGAYGVGKHLTAQQKTDVYNAIRTLARAVDTSLIP